MVDVPRLASDPQAAQLSDHGQRAGYLGEESVDFGVLLTDLPTLVVVILGVPALIGAYIVGSEFLVRRLSDKRRPQVRPWFWVGPALFLVAAYLLLPAIGTVFQSFENNNGNFIGLGNYGSQFANFPTGA